MCLDDFLRLSHEGFQEVYKQYLEKAKDEHKIRTEELRSAVVMHFNISPQYEGWIDPRKAWPLPWEDQPKKKKKRQGSSKERMKMLDKKWSQSNKNQQNEQ